MGREREIDWRAIAVTFVLTAAAYVTRAITTGATTPLINDTDDAMRLVEVRDLLAGQGWYDLVQHRLNAPFGAEMHWSRLVDAPIAGLIGLLRLFLGDSADTAAAFIWPLLLLLLLLWLSALVAHRLAGREAVLPGVVLPAVSLVTMSEFAPGRFDHHSVQILLALGTLFATFEATRRPGFGFWAALGASAAIAVGIESLPTAAAAILAFGLLWVFDARRAAALRWFGIGLCLTSIGLCVALVPPERLFAPYCDALSIVYVAALAGTGLLLALISLLPLRSPWLRLLAGLVAGGALLAAIGLAFPQCLEGPYAAVDPWLVENWLSRIDEAKPLWHLFANDPVYLAGVGIPVLLGTAFAATRLLDTGSENWPRWLAYFLFLLLAALIMLLQIRGARLATSLAPPAGAALIAAVRAWYMARPRLLPALGLIGSWIGFSGLVLALATAFATQLAPGPATTNTTANATAGESACRMPAAFAELAALPPQPVMTPIDLGSHALAFTPHSVVAAPYHRDGQGLRDTFAFFNRPASEARAILAQRGIRLVAICMGMPELRGLADAAPDSLVQLLPQDRLPDWLTEISAPGSTIRLFSVAGS